MFHLLSNIDSSSVIDAKILTKKKIPVTTKPVFTCSKLRIKSPGQGFKYVQI